MVNRRDPSTSPPPMASPEWYEVVTLPESPLRLERGPLLDVMAVLDPSPDATAPPATWTPITSAVAKTSGRGLKHGFIGMRSHPTHARSEPASVAGQPTGISDCSPTQTAETCSDGRFMMLPEVGDLGLAPHKHMGYSPPTISSARNLAPRIVVPVPFPSKPNSLPSSSVT